MRYDLPAAIRDQFAPEDTIDMDSYVDDCRCLCRAHITVQDGLLNAHGRAFFDRLLIRGSLHIDGNADLQRLPDRLAVTGSIFVSDCLNLKIMPSQMYAGESIYMERVNIRDLPKVMEAGRDIVMNECPNVLEIPERVTADCLYAAGCTKLTSIASTHAFHVLDLSETPVEEVPSNLTIKNKLNLRRCTNLALINEGATVRNAIDVRGCDKLFTLPDSLQPAIAITDGMMLANDWVVVPNMSAVEASMCLGVKGIEAFPHRHFKNFKKMHDAVVAVDRDGKGYRRGHAVGLLKTDRRSKGTEDFLQKLIQDHFKDRPLLLSGPARAKRLK